MHCEKINKQMLVDDDHNSGFGGSSCTLCDIRRDNQDFAIDCWDKSLTHIHRRLMMATRPVVSGAAAFCFGSDSSTGGLANRKRNLEDQILSVFENAGLADQIIEECWTSSSKAHPDIGAVCLRNDENVLDGKLALQCLSNFVPTCSPLCRFCGRIFPKPNLFDRLKNSVDEDSHDFSNLVTLVFRDMSVAGRNAFLHMCACYGDKAGPLVKIISDIDNTILESNATGKNFVTHRDGECVPGAMELICAINFSKTEPIPQQTRSCGGSGAGAFPNIVPSLVECAHVPTTTFISARPAEIEHASILAVSSKLSKRSTAKKFAQDHRLPFSFLCGTFSGPLLLLAGHLLKCQSLVARANVIMAEKKWEKYLQMKSIYPHNRFVFLGDTTQGDSIFASWLVNPEMHGGSTENFAFIRNVNSEKKFSAFHHSPRFVHPRILQVSSWFDALNFAPCDVVLPSAKVAWKQVCVSTYLNETLVEASEKPDIVKNVDIKSLEGFVAQRRM